eukprot:COSAG01_NODE_23063_length_829_cov_76.032877_1_plen_172_part_01
MRLEIESQIARALSRWYRMNHQCSAVANVKLVTLPNGTPGWIAKRRILPQDQLTWDYGHGTRQWDRLDKQQKKRLSLGTIGRWHSRATKRANHHTSLRALINRLRDVAACDEHDATDALRIMASDVSYGASILSKCMQALDQQAWDAAMHVVHYLKGTGKEGISYHNSGNLE